MKAFLFRFGFDLFEKLESLATAGVGEAVETITDRISVLGHKVRVDVTLTRES